LILHFWKGSLRKTYHRNGKLFLFTNRKVKKKFLGFAWCVKHKDFLEMFWNVKSDMINWATHNIHIHTLQSLAILFCTWTLRNKAFSSEIVEMLLSFFFSFVWNIRYCCLTVHFYTCLQISQATQIFQICNWKWLKFVEALMHVNMFICNIVKIQWKHF